MADILDIGYDVDVNEFMEECLGQADRESLADSNPEDESERTSESESDSVPVHQSRRQLFESEQIDESAVNQNPGELEANEIPPPIESNWLFVDGQIIDPNAKQIDKTKTDAIYLAFDQIVCIPHNSILKFRRWKYWTPIGKIIFRWNDVLELTFAKLKQ